MNSFKYVGYAVQSKIFISNSKKNACNQTHVSGDELNKPMASVQILLLLYTIYNMYITCILLK